MDVLFDKIYIINLEKDKERLAQATKELKKINNTKFEVFKAINGKDLDQKFIDNYTKHGVKKLISKGSMGCYISHRLLWLEIIDKNFDKVLILEDDIELIYEASEVVPYVSKCLSELPEKWDILLLGNMFVSESGSIMNKLTKKFTNINTKIFSDNLLFTDGFVGNHSLVISNQGARNLLENLDKIYFSHDFITRGPIFKIYASRNLIFRQNHSPDGNMSSSKPYLLNRTYKKINVSKLLDDSNNNDNLEWIAGYSPYSIGNNKISMVSILFFILGFLWPRITLLFLILDVFLFTLLSKNRSYDDYSTLFIALFLGLFTRILSVVIINRKLLIDYYVRKK